MPVLDSTVKRSFGILKFGALLFLASCLQTRQELNDRTNFQSHMDETYQAQREQSAGSGEAQEAVNPLKVRGADSERSSGVVMPPVDSEELIRQQLGKIEELEHKLSQWEEQQAQRELKHQEDLRALQAQIEEIKQNQNTVKPATEEAPTSPEQIWLKAEKLFDEKEYRRAILTYQQYREQSPKGPKVSEASYKMGLSFENLQMWEEAKAFYLEVIQQFPKSPEAAKSRVRLKKSK